MLSETLRAASPGRVRAAVIGLAISIVSVVLLVSLIDVGATVDVLAGTDLRWLALTLLMVPAQVFLRSLRWQLLLPRGDDGRRPAVRRIASALLVGQFANLVLPARLGEAVRAYLVGRRERIALPRVLGSVLLERVIDLGSLGVVTLAAAALAGAPEWIVQGGGLVAIVAAVAVVLLAASAIPRALALLARALGKGGRLERAFAVATSFGEGAGGDGRRSLAAAVALSTITWFFVGATFWLVARSLDIPLTPGQALLVAAVTSLGIAIPSAPANIGTFEAAAVVAATTLGVPAAEALALAVVAHVVSTLPFAVAGGSVVAWMSLSLRRVATEAAEAATAFRRPIPEAERPS